MKKHNSQHYSFIDLFAGAGGLSEGFVASGFKPIAHVEMDYHACLTLKTRTAFHLLRQSGKLEKYNSYLTGSISRDELYALIPPEELAQVINRTMSEETMDDLFQDIDINLKNGNHQSVDVIIGGPPCQAYSVIGRARKADGMRGDPRNYLYKLYRDVLEKYRPKIFIFENVPGLYTAEDGKHYDDMKCDFENIGYTLTPHLCNAYEFGVLQKRLRVILVGRLEKANYSCPSFTKVVTKATVRDLFRDLPSLQAGETDNNYRSEVFSSYLLNSGIRTREDILTWNTARPHNERDRSIYKLAINRWVNNRYRLRYTDVPAELQTHKNVSAFLDRFKVVADDLPMSHTVVAHIAKDGHYFIHPDPQQARSLTVREAARIQSFPDNFFFEGPRTAAFTQIGNAVPPLMAKKLAQGILEVLQKGDHNGS